MLYISVYSTNSNTGLILTVCEVFTDVVKGVYRIVYNGSLFISCIFYEHIAWTKQGSVMSEWQWMKMQVSDIMADFCMDMCTLATSVLQLSTHDHYFVSVILYWQSICIASRWINIASVIHMPNWLVSDMCY